MSDRIIGVILAAGMSTRLGRPKQLLDLAGTPLVRHVAERALASALDDVIVVTGAVADDVTAALDGLAVEIVYNADFATGQASSFVTGVRAAEAFAADAIVVLLSDQPTVAIAAIDAVVARRRAARAGIVQTGYGATPSHPTLLGSEFFPKLLAVTGDQGAREVIRAHRDAVAIVPSGEDMPPIDVDTEEAYQALLEMHRPGS